MIVVTEATGQLGRLIVQRLVGRVAAAQVGASVRDPARAADLAASGMRVRRGDVAEPESLPHGRRTDAAADGPGDARPRGPRARRRRR
jgi:uncharacterized protein YbjT (DUF2867 family)